MFDMKEKTVVVTGGSTGIGAAFARRVASEGARVMVVARGRTRLEALATEISGRHGVEVLAHAEDLSKPGAGGRVLEALHAKGWKADVLVNNAGFASYGPLETQALSVLREEIDLNVTGLVELTHAFLPELIARRGGIIHVASTAAFQPVPYMAVYGATKAFVLSFSEAVWFENRARGLRVLALCPGATETPFFDRVGAEEASLGARATPESVVEVGLKAFASNRSHVVAGLGNYWAAQTARLVTRQAAARITGGLMKPKPGARIATSTQRTP